MKPLRCVITVALIVGLVAFAAHSGAGLQLKSEANESAETQLISVEDINSKRVVLIGRLGIPLGELVDIRGCWIEGPQSKPTGPEFRVQHVNGKPLRQPVQFNHADVSRFAGRDEPEFQIGDVWELRGLETGGMHGVSLKVFDEADEPPAAQRAVGFVTNIIYVRARQIGTAK